MTQMADTLLLYCPYDRKVTGHARRGPEGTVVCLECGRRLDVAHMERPTAVIPLTPPPDHFNGPRSRSMRARRAAIWRRRSQAPWVPLGLVGLITVGAMFALIASLGSPFGAPSDTTAKATAAAADQSAASQPPPVPVAAPEASAAPATDLQVANTGGTGVYIRRTPDMTDRLRAWGDGAALKVIGPDVNQDGVDWKHVQDPAGDQGWIPAEYTAPAG